MTGKKISRRHRAAFENIRQHDQNGDERWSARALAPLLDYPQWRNFLPVLERANQACQQSGESVAYHFADNRKMVDIGSGAQREVEDVRLSRYACYLIVQNGDPTKSVIANGQTSFAIQTRRQELADETKFAQLSEDENRLAIRNELAAHNKQLAAAAKDAGVESALDYAVFQDHGYKGLYGGLGAKDIHARKSLKKNCAVTRYVAKPRRTRHTWR
jgi:DNA-damage-inducible protein D